MYAKYFGLKEAPFSIAPNPRYLYMSPQHKEALAHLLYGIVGDGGFVLLTGEVGTGKTTVSRCLLEQLTEQTDVAYILNPMLKATELLAAICDELGIHYEKKAQTLHTLSQHLYRFLIENHTQGRNTVLIIDEAQNLTDKSLELVRLLTNLETNTKKLLKIIFVGQPELNERLSQQKFRQLSQRITARFHMNSLTLQDTETYIQHRLKVAGLPAGQSIFPKHIIKSIHKKTNGIPRLINVLCDRILLGVYSQNLQQINDDVLQKSCLEVFGEYEKPAALNVGVLSFELPKFLSKLPSTAFGNNLKPWHKGFATGCIIAILVGITSWKLGQNKNEQPQEQQVVTSNSVSQFANLPQVTVSNPRAQTQPTDTLVLPQSIPAPEPQMELGPGNQSPLQTINPGTSQISNTSVTQADIQILESIPFNAKFFTRNLALGDLLGRLPNFSIASNKVSKPCSYIVAKKWQCVQRANRLISDLRQFNRPSVLTIKGQAGSSSHVLLLGLTNSEAILAVKDDPYSRVTINIDALQQVWDGNVTLMWQPPESYEGSIKKGDISPLVEWLNVQFAMLDGKSVIMAGTLFDSSLSERVKRFQREQGLRNDGIVGLTTLLRINEKMNETLILENSNNIAAAGNY
ncbi:MAG: AAA family ATPase [Cellvibrionaceae bacterium]